MGAITPSSTFARPADTTAYASGDLVANSTTAGSVVGLSFTCNALRIKGQFRAAVKKAQLRKSSTTVTAGSFTLHLFDRAKTVSNGDNGALAITTQAGYIGSVSLDVSTGAHTFAGGVIGNSADVNLPFEIPEDGLIWGYLSVGGAYAPASAESFTVQLSIE